MKMYMLIPSEVLDTILDDKEIIKRATSVTKNYDLFTEACDNYFPKEKAT